jgi:hypothetical protein
VSKRSPILGYNHNVLYRGLVFHVQTEDSGVSTPHLFTHLFHQGVIVSTRKLVYDAGSAEESIKSLMQAQHKATLKDLRRGHFDDKIDSYLGGTPGLLPRDAEEAGDRPAEAEPAPSPGTVEDIAVGAPTDQVQPMFDESSTPVSIAIGAPAAVEAPLPVAAPAVVEAPLVAEKTPPPARPTIPPVPAIPRRPTTEHPHPHTHTPSAARSLPALLDTTVRTPPPAFDSSPEIDVPELEIQLELDDHDEAVRMPRRAARDTETQPFNELAKPTLDVRFDDHTRPTVGNIAESARRTSVISDGIPGPNRPSSPAIPGLPADSRRPGERPSTINAATLPPARPITRPPTRPALSLPPVGARPMTSDERIRREAEAAEAYAQAPSSEQPPGDRPGHYAQHKKAPPRSPTEGPKNERPGPAAIPAGLGRPQPRAATPAATAKPGTTPPAPGSAPAPAPRAPSPQSAVHTEPLLARTPTPARISPPGPVLSRSGASGNGVVMTRPAVIVGAPTKSMGTVPRIRKAREDEGRGFGQGLISEKSLDEVILAYLSEDADEK